MSNSMEFLQKEILHQQYRDACFQLETFIRSGKPGELMALVGPTKIGKSRALQKVVRALILEEREKLEQDASYAPILLLEAPAALDRKEYLHDWLYRALQGLMEPLIEFRADRSAQASALTGLRASEQAMRRGLENALRSRQTHTIIIDQAQRMILPEHKHRRRLHSILEVTHSIAEMAGCRLLLCGTYDIWDHIKANDVLASRCTLAHFHRYDVARNEEDYRIWCDTLFTIQSLLPAAFHKGWNENARLLLEGSLGCVGLLIDWLARASQQKMAGRASLSFSQCLERTMLPLGLRETLMHQILAGEKLLEPEANDVVAALLGLTQEKPARPPMRRGKPGTRNPTRDPVWTGREALE